MSKGKPPVLTEILDDAQARRRAGLDAAALEALAGELERAVLARLGPEIDRILQERLTRTLNLGLDAARTELMASVTKMVREAVAASVARVRAQP